MQSPEPDAAARDAICHWPRLLELAAFAAREHGFEDRDGGFGVTYPGDLDDYDRASGEHIPDGFVQIYGFGGPPDGYEVLVPEPLYLATLASVLTAAGYATEAARIQSLADQRPAEQDAAPDRGGE